MPEEIKLIRLSSLKKVFLDEKPEEDFERGSMLINEKYSFQVAFSVINVPRNAYFAKLRIDSPLKEYISVRLVGNLPSVLPTYEKYDDYYLRTKPGLFPDPLYEIKDDTVKVLKNKWQSIWIAIQGTEGLKPGKYPVEITFTIPGVDFWGTPVNSQKQNLESSISVEIEVIDACLPEQKLIYTNWFHCDCIASMYNCEIFSDIHWNLIDKFIASAASNGMNMILTPAFTPALDTPIGGERATVQLVDVYKRGEDYTFGFDKFNKWVDICLKNGIRYFEHSHFFTQWGAKFAPKVMAYEDGVYKRIFGWETPATGKEYVNFLNQYIPALINFLKERGVDRRTYFHISDEPVMKDLETYAAALNVVKDKLDGYKIFDALSDFGFYEKGFVQTPVSCTNHIDDFIGKVDDLWAYYTGFQSVKLPNRLFSMPSARNRILGTQLYKYNIKGFLHWAFNFYYTTLSREECNPFVSTDAFGEFPSGTAYMVYPEADGPIESLRLIVFNEGLQDMRAMQLLESYTGKENVMSIIEDSIPKITFTEYPHDDKYLFNMRERINREIAKQVVRK